jgi:hypothetical protein
MRRYVFVSLLAIGAMILACITALLAESHLASRNSVEVFNPSLQYLTLQNCLADEAGSGWVIQDAVGKHDLYRKVTGGVIVQPKSDVKATSSFVHNGTTYSLATRRDKESMLVLLESKDGAVHEVYLTRDR